MPRRIAFLLVFFMQLRVLLVLDNPVFVSIFEFDATGGAKNGSPTACRTIAGFDINVFRRLDSGSDALWQGQLVLRGKFGTHGDG